MMMNKRPATTTILRQKTKEQGQPWAPFESASEWKLAEWISNTLGHSETDEFLDLEKVRKPLILIINESLRHNCLCR